MRNLKKILAMALALIMSLSLMATAGAANFKDAASINEKYETAVEVLEGLGVFKGYSNGNFEPTGSITRAETAAIIYRIVTGDVEDEQVKIYADYNLFKDVKSDAWYAGYVNFCANAEYIKGDGKGNFNPQEKVEGYAALAMILRAIGYTANGSFTGSDWRTQTARVGEARKITKNITEGTLRANADRQTVAEILYQAIMVNMVDHNVLNTLNGNQGYTEKSETLGQKTFGLEYVSGVVMANEWANLNEGGTKVLDAGKTNILVTETYQDTPVTAKVGGSITVEAVVSSDMQEALDAVGLTYDAHIANPDGKGVRALTLTKSDKNNVAYNEGKGVYVPADHDLMNNSSWNTIQDLAGSIALNNDTEYFINYAQEWDDECQSDYRISYAIAEATVNAEGHEEWKAYIDELYDLTERGTIPTPANSKYPGHYLGKRNIDIDLNLDGTIAENGSETFSCWVVAIVPNKTINKYDLQIMQEIFFTADRIGINGAIVGADQTLMLKNYAIGEVYVGTTSMEDYSDTMSWKEFKAKYFIIDVNSRKFNTCEIGNSLRVIDNNADGKAEYVLRIDYTQDKVIGTYKNQPAGYELAIGNFEGNLLYNPKADEIKQGTVFNYTEIDEKLYVWPATVVTGIVSQKDFNKITITVDGNVYNQSGIENDTRLDENIMLMNQGVTYNMYMDVYDINVRSYDGQTGKYALLTEMYPTSNYNGNHVYDYGAIAEVKIGDADVTEYPVVTGQNRNLFFNPWIWTWGLRGYFGVNAGTSGAGAAIPGASIYNANYLQPAVAHLGVSGLKANDRTTVTNYPVNIGWTDNEEAYKLSDWYRAVAGMKAYPTVGDPAKEALWLNGNGGKYGVFNYGSFIYDQDAYDEDPTDGIVESTSSFTNVATFVDNNGTLTLGSASKLSRDRATGFQNYRVGAKAAFAITGLKQYDMGTESALVATLAAYLDKQTVGSTVATAEGTTYTVGANSDANKAVAQSWFDNYAAADNYGDGTGIYPVWETDYVQLDLSTGDMGQAWGADGVAVKAGTRHYHIADGLRADNAVTSDYAADYNTNANHYVDATVDTEFYIVIPGGKTSILYRVGYADLPTIKANEIRAAYAVATNTSAQSNGQDYWVADVIVIETTQLTYDWDSISLVYNNPYVQNGYTRLANTLNNEWHNLQPDYSNKAMMNITPKGEFSNTGWGDWSWSQFNSSNYGFWRLYQTELTEPGQMSVGKAVEITEDYNKWGIYAGTATRIEKLQTSRYLDVSVEKTGFEQSYAIDVRCGTDDEVPFYRITGTAQHYGTIFSVTQLNPNNTLRWSDIKNGDQLIWVYEKNTGKVAFVVDMGARDKYTAPDWLFKASESLATEAPTSLYWKIMKDEHPVTPPPAKTAQDYIDEVKAILAKENPAATLEELEEAMDILDTILAPDSGLTFTSEQLGEIGAKTDAADTDGSLYAQIKAAMAPFEAAEVERLQDAAKALVAAANTELTGFIAPAAVTAMNAAIDAADTLEEIRAIYDEENDSLKGTNDDVAAFNAAVTLATSKKTAKAEKVVPADLATYTVATDAKTALDAVLENTASTQQQVTDAIAAFDAAIALANNQKAAVAAAQALVPAGSADVPAVQTALNNLIDAIKGTTTQAGLDDIYDGTDFVTGHTEADALKAALADVKATITLDGDGDDNRAITFEPANATGEFAVGSTAVFTITPADSTPNIVKVWYTVDGQLGEFQPTVVDAATHKYSITVNSASDITIWTTEAAAQYALKLDKAGIQTIQIVNDGTVVPLATAGTDTSTNVLFGKTVTITTTNGKPLYLATVPSTATVQGIGTGKLVISGLTADTTIKVVDTNPNP